jgi:transglutaminase-like putative cysteine protease
MRRSLVSNSTAPVFSASLVGGNTDDIYWRLLTMDSFRMGPDGDWWYASDAEVEKLADTGWEKAEFRFRGPTEPLSAEVTIAQLGQSQLPAPYSPTFLESSERLIRNTGRVNPRDGSIEIEGVTREGMTYHVDADVPRPDVSVLALLDDGSLSPAFAVAAGNGEFRSGGLPGTRQKLSDSEFERYTRLPAEFPVAISNLASAVTLGLETDYERGLALERFFRRPSNQFHYSVDIPPDQQDSELEDWLLDDSPGSGYRTGYCEQFALSMAVMARSLDIPTRGVMGFTPGQPAPNGDVVVLDHNAHAWVELWMPSQGWVRFDPTPRGDGVNPSTSAGIADLDRSLALVAEQARAGSPNPGTGSPSGPEPPAPPDGPDVTPEPGNSRSGSTVSTWVRAAAAGSFVLGLALTAIPVVKRGRRRSRMQRLSDGDLNAAWAEIVDYLIDSGLLVDPANTPRELASATDDAMRPLADVYCEATYGPQHELAPAAIHVATASLTATVDTLHGRMTRWERIRQRYRVKTLLPDRIRRNRSLAPATVRDVGSSQAPAPR